MPLAESGRDPTDGVPRSTHTFVFRKRKLIFREVK